MEKSIISPNGTPCCVGLIKCAALPLARQGLGSPWVSTLRCVTSSQRRARDYQAAASELLMKPKAWTNNNVKGGGKKKKKKCFINSVYENGWREKKRLSAALNESRLAKQLGMISLHGAVYYCVMMCCPVNCILGGDLMYFLPIASRKKTTTNFLGWLAAFNQRCWECENSETSTPRLHRALLTLLMYMCPIISPSCLRFTQGCTCFFYNSHSRLCLFVFKVQFSLAL